jgi:glyoxylase-like metal-dependent hydrolase (beta-lactamase superfamily II)
MPATVEIVRPLPGDTFWSVWGDVTTRVTFDQWTLEPGGVRYPHLWLTEGNGQPSRTLSIDGIEFNPPLAPEVFAASPAAIAEAVKRRRDIDDIAYPGRAKAVSVAPGIIQVPGFWNVEEVETPKGVYVLEGPLSNVYSAGVIAELKGEGRPILGVITTSDSWPHIGGLRQYAAEGAPIYAVDLNRPILERLFSAPHRQRPDALALHPRKPDVRYVTTPIELGEGDTRMRLIPLRTVSGERQMAVYFPASRVLYTSDLFAVEPNDVWLPGYVDELRQMIAREHLDVETVFGMHYGPTPWSRVLTLKAPA